MNIFLSIILCIAMAVGGTANLPAQKETSDVWTVSNVVISDGKETVTLDKTLVLRSAVGAEDAALQLEIFSGDTLMLPVSASLSADEMKICFGLGKQAYSISNDVIFEAGEMTGEDADILDKASVLMMDLGRFMAKLHEPGYIDEVDERLSRAESFIYTENKFTEVEIDGMLYPAQYRKGAYDDMSMLKVLDELDSSGMPELEALIGSTAELLSISAGVESGKGFAGLMERMRVDEDEMAETAIEEVSMEQDGLEYYSSVSRAADETEKLSCTDYTEVIARDGSTRVRMRREEMMDKDTAGADIAVEISGAPEAPEALNASAEIVIFEDFSHPVDWSEEELIYLCTDETRMNIGLACTKQNGLWTSKLDAGGSVVSSYGYEDDNISKEFPLEMHFSCTESGDAENPLRSFALNIAADGKALNLSFDLSRAEESWIDPMAGLEVYPIDLDDDGPAMRKMTADIMAISGSLMMLGAQEDIMGAAEILENISGDGEYFEVQSHGEAEEKMGLKLPVFTPPAGYELDSIEIAEDLSCADFYYWSGIEEDYILISCNDFREMAPYSGLNMEALEKGTVVQTEIEDGIAYAINVYTSKLHIVISTDGVRANEIEGLLKGLDIAPLFMSDAELAALEEAGRREL